MATIPIVPDENILDPETNDLTENWRDFFVLLTQALRQCVGNEGFQISAQNSGDISLIEPKALTGTLIFDTSAVNGGTMDDPNGQLLVRLADGTFRPITNS